MARDDGKVLKRIQGYRGLFVGLELGDGSERGLRRGGFRRRQEADADEARELLEGEGEGELGLVCGDVGDEELGRGGRRDGVLSLGERRCPVCGGLWPVAALL